MAIEVQFETRFGDFEMLRAMGPLDEALEAIINAGAKPATAQQVARARIVAGLKSDVSQCGSWVAENFVYFPSGKILVTPAEHSPILKHAYKATDAHRSGKEFYISGEEAASLEKLAKSDKVYTLKQNENHEIPIKKFAQGSLARFLFGDTAVDYAKFLQKAGVNAVPVWLLGVKYQKSQPKAFTRALWLHDVGGRSLLDGSQGLCYDCRARGVRGISYESVAQKYGLKSPAKLQEVLENTLKS